MKKIDIITATVPPYVCGIGDYTAQLAQVLKPYASVRLLSGQTKFDPQPGVAVESVFSRDVPKSIWEVARFVDASPPDWLIVQYAPDTLVQRGVTPLPRVLRSLRKKHSSLRVAVMVHEWVNPAVNLKSSIQSVLLRAQLRSMGRVADQMFFAIEPWVQQVRSWFPHTPSEFMPVGSVMPHFPMERSEAKKRLGIAEETFVVGLFGRLNETSDLNWVRQAMHEIRKKVPNTLLLYIGIYGDILRSELQDAGPIMAEGVSSEEVSRRFSAMDMYLLPDRGGVSARRTRLMTSLQHGIPTIGTNGPATDQILLDAGGRALVLTPISDINQFVQEAVNLAQDKERRQQLGSEAHHFYESNFGWSHITEQWVRSLDLTAAL